MMSCSTDLRNFEKPATAKKKKWPYNDTSMRSFSCSLPGASLADSPPSSMTWTQQATRARRKLHSRLQARELKAANTIWADVSRRQYRSVYQVNAAGVTSSASFLWVPSCQTDLVHVSDSMKLCNQKSREHDSNQDTVLSDRVIHNYRTKLRASKSQVARSHRIC